MTSYTSIASAAKIIGIRDDTVRLYSEALSIALELANTTPENGMHLLESARIYECMGEVAKQGGSASVARNDYLEVLRIRQQLVGLQIDNALSA